MLFLKWFFYFIFIVLAVVCGLAIWNYVFGVKLQNKVFKQMSAWFDSDDNDATDEQVGEATCTTTNSKKSTSTSKA